MKRAFFTWFIIVFFRMATPFLGVFVHNEFDFVRNNLHIVFELPIYNSIYKEIFGFIFQLITIIKIFSVKIMSAVFIYLIITPLANNNF